MISNTLRNLITSWLENPSLYDTVATEAMLKDPLWFHYTVSPVLLS